MQVQVSLTFLMRLMSGVHLDTISAISPMFLVAKPITALVGSKKMARSAMSRASSSSKALFMASGVNMEISHSGGYRQYMQKSLIFE